MLVRLAALDGAVVADLTGRLPGRGGYLHPRRECLEKFTRAKVREFRSLKRGLALDERRQLAKRIAELISGAVG